MAVGNIKNCVWRHFVNYLSWTLYGCIFWFSFACDRMFHEYYCVVCCFGVMNVNNNAVHRTDFSEAVFRVWQTSLLRLGYLTSVSCSRLWRTLDDRIRTRLITHGTLWLLGHSLKYDTKPYSSGALAECYFRSDSHTIEPRAGIQRSSWRGQWNLRLLPSSHCHLSFWW